jgi:hypothetical protein
MLPRSSWDSGIRAFLLDRVEVEPATREKKKKNKKEKKKE